MKRHFHLLLITAYGGVGEGRSAGPGRMCSGLPCLKGLSESTLARGSRETGGEAIEEQKTNWAFSKSKAISLCCDKRRYRPHLCLLGSRNS